MVKFFKKLFNIKTTRYFTVYYAFSADEGFGNGHANIKCSGINAFFSFDEFIEKQKIKSPSYYNFTITGFNELSKDDYYQSMSKKTN
jgi:hypothetical protein